MLYAGLIWNVFNVISNKWTETYKKKHKIKFINFPQRAGRYDDDGEGRLIYIYIYIEWK